MIVNCKCKGKRLCVNAHNLQDCVKYTVLDDEYEGKRSCVNAQ